MGTIFILELLLIAATHAVPVDRQTQQLAMDDMWMASDGNWLNDDILGVAGGVPEGCSGKPADVYFVFDTSTGVTEEQIQQQKEYATNIVAVFYLKHDKTHVGALSYGQTVASQIPLGAYDKKDELITAINSVASVGGDRNTGEALRFMKETAFARDVARKGVAHVVIFFLSGNSENHEDAYLQALEAKKTGIYIYAVGIGDSVNRDEITAIASLPSYDFIYTYGDYTMADSLISLLSITVCGFSNIIDPGMKQKACTARRPVDVIFALDHVSIGTKHSRDVLEFIQEITSEFDSSSNNIQANLLLGKNPIYGRVSKHFQTVEEFDSSINGIDFLKFSDIMRRSRMMFAKGRRHVQKTLILFVDNNVDITKSAINEARRNKFSKMETYVVAVGTTMDVGTLNVLASGPDRDHLLRIPSYRYLWESKDRLLKLMCRGW